jgi:hypothetical protein
MKKHILLIAPLLIAIMFATAQTNSRIAIPSNGKPTAGLTVSPITDVTATVKWKAMSGAQSYNLQYKQVLASSWISINVSSTSFIITELLPLTRYEFRVQVVYTYGTSPFTSSELFNTIASVPCDPTFGLTANPVTDVSATLKWKAVGAASYNLQYREYGAASWATISTTSTSQEVTNLKASTRYEFRVQVVCGSVSSSYCDASTFTDRKSTRLNSSHRTRLY